MIERLSGGDWREVELPTRDELYDYLRWAAEKFDMEISDVYRLYFGYGVGAVTTVDVWDQ